MKTIKIKFVHSTLIQKTITFLMSLTMVAFISFNANAQLFEENFSYTAGDTLANNWVLHSTSNPTAPIYIQAGSLSYTNYPSNSGNCAKMTTGNDYNKAFTATAVSSGNLYFAMLVNLDSARTTEYFFHTYRTGATTTYLNRVYVKKALNGNLAFGILKGSSASSVAWTDSIYTAGTTHLIVLKVEIVAGATNDLISLFINPTINGTEPTATKTATDVGSADYTDIDRIAIRQGSPSSCPSLRIDGIRVATSWTSAVGGVGINEIEANTIGIYPNPSNGKFTVNVEKFNNGEIKVYSIVGSLILSQQITKANNEFDLSSYGKGMYFVQYTNAKSGKSWTEKLIVK